MSGLHFQVWALFFKDNRRICNPLRNLSANPPECRSPSATARSVQSPGVSRAGVANLHFRASAGHPAVRLPPGPLPLPGNRGKTRKDNQFRDLDMTDFAARRRMMVDTQVRPNDVTKFPIIDAMLAVPREAYLPADQREAAYVGENLEIAEGRVLLEPRTIAKMLDALDIQPDELALDLGCGLGYTAALVARLAEAVVAVEEDAEFAAEAQARLSSQGVDNAAVIAGPLAEGSAKHGPYDVILVEGAVEHVPEALLAQLKSGGRIACLFMDGPLGTVRIGKKADGSVAWRQAFNAAAPVLPGFAAEPGFVL